MLYWNSRSLPELQGLNFRERMQVLRNAADALPTPQKLLLNLLKLAVLIPLFLLIARAPDLATAALYVLTLVLLYPLVTRPVTFYLVRPSLTKIRTHLTTKSQH